MGNCWATRDKFFLSDVRDKKKEMTILKTIFLFDFNKSDPKGITVDETLMRVLTNDLAEFASPHLAHILMVEFKKFLFLMVMNQIDTKDSKC